MIRYWLDIVLSICLCYTFIFQNNIKYSVLVMVVCLFTLKGTKIHASIKKTLMYKFEKLLVEGKVYSVSSFVLVDSSGEYKTTRHNYKICFMYNTEVRPMDQFPIDAFPYSFVPLADLLAPTYDSSFLIGIILDFYLPMTIMCSTPLTISYSIWLCFADVIGILTGVGVEREIVTNGKKSKMNVIEIDSAG